MEDIERFIPVTIDEYLDERIAFCEFGYKHDPERWECALSKLKYCKSLDRDFHSLQFREIFNEFINANKDTIKSQLKYGSNPERDYLLRMDQALTLLLQK